MNLPKRAEDAHATLAAAFNTGNAAIVMSMYDTSGIIVPEPNKPVSGKEDRAGGVVWRYRDSDNYYLARVNSLTRNVVVYKVRNGVRTQVMPAAHHEIPANAWSILKVSVRGDRFQVYVDHRRILQGVDRTFGAAGKVGLWTVADSVTYFDDFRVYPK